MDFAEGGIEEELYALAEGLMDSRHWSRKASNTAFVTDKIEGGIIITINSPMLDLLKNLISDAITGDSATENEIIALGRALEDPDKCYQLRIKKREAKQRRDNERSIPR